MAYLKKEDQAAYGAKWYRANKVRVLFLKKLRARQKSAEKSHNRQVIRENFPSSVCLIERCEDCLRYGFIWHDHKRDRKRICLTPARQFNWGGGGTESICDECARNNKNFSPLWECEWCGRWGRHHTTAIHGRYVTTDAALRDWQYKIICMACWNKDKALTKQARDVMTQKKALEKFKSYIHQLSKGKRYGESTENCFEASKD